MATQPTDVREVPAELRDRRDAIRDLVREIDGPWDPRQPFAGQLGATSEVRRVVVGRDVKQG